MTWQRQFVKFWIAMMTIGIVIALAWNAEADHAWKCNMCNKLFSRPQPMQITVTYNDVGSIGQGSFKVEKYFYSFSVCDAWAGWSTYPKSDIDLCRRCIKEIIHKWLEVEDKKEEDRSNETPNTHALPSDKSVK